MDHPEEVGEDLDLPSELRTSIRDKQIRGPKRPQPQILQNLARESAIGAVGQVAHVVVRKSIDEVSDRVFHPLTIPDEKRIPRNSFIELTRFRISHLRGRLRSTCLTPRYLDEGKHVGYRMRLHGKALE